MQGLGRNFGAAVEGEDKEAEGRVRWRLMKMRIGRIFRGDSVEQGFILEVNSNPFTFYPVFSLVLVWRRQLSSCHCVSTHPLQK